MPSSCFGLRWFHILASGAITVGLTSGCELVVGELPQAVDSVVAPGTTDSGVSGAGGRSGSGGVAFGDTGGASGATHGGGTSHSGGASTEGGSAGAGAGGSYQGGNGGSSDGGATSAAGGDSGGPGAGGTATTGGASGNGGAPNTGGQAANGGASTGGRVATGGAPSTGGQTGSGGGGSCKKPPCDCDGDGANAVGCNGGDDCDDADPLVFKNEPTYYATPSLHRGFDYDCSNTFDGDPAIAKRQNCSVTDILACYTTTDGFLNPLPACGGTGDWGTCIKPPPLAVTCEPYKKGTQLLTCK